MNKLLWLLPVTLLLYACPFESTVALEKKPVEPVDSSLFGYWYGIVKDGSDFFGIEALDITGHSDSVYVITRYGKAIKGDIILPDTAYFTGYTSWIGGNQYMNIVADIIIDEPRKNSKIREMRKQRVYYIARLDRSNDTLTVKTVTENFSPKKYFVSPEDIKQAIVKQTSDKVDIFDDQYSLSYKRITKPQPFKSF
ncbi:MAG: hypothetical protein WBC06_14250 [Chitinophagaceae bacterium]